MGTETKGRTPTAAPALENSPQKELEGPTFTSLQSGNISPQETSLAPGPRLPVAPSSSSGTPFPMQYQEQQPTHCFGTAESSTPHFTDEKTSPEK